MRLQEDPMHLWADSFRVCEIGRLRAAWCLRVAFLRKRGSIWFTITYQLGSARYTCMLHEKYHTVLIACDELCIPDYVHLYACPRIHPLGKIATASFQLEKFRSHFFSILDFAQARSSIRKLPGIVWAAPAELWELRKWAWDPRVSRSAVYSDENVIRAEYP